MSSFKLVDGYLERLPRGLDSHPECLVKAAVMRDQIRTRPFDASHLRRLPGPVAELVRDPPPVSSWVPEVHAMVILLAMREAHFPADSEVEYEEWTHERNRRLLGSRLYRAVFMVMSLERLFRGAGRRWSRVRRGSHLEVVELGPGHRRLETHYPSYLHPRELAIGLRGAFRAVADLAGAQDVELGEPVVGEHAMTLDLRYQP